MAKRTIKIYKSYAFRDQDPIVSEVLSVRKHEADARGISVKTMTKIACELSGLSPSTPRNWDIKKTKRPQFATLNAFLRTMDARLGVIRGHVRKK